MSKQFFVHYDYVCWKCPKRHEATATVKAETADEAQIVFEAESAAWPGMDNWEYDTTVTGVSWRL